MMEDAYERQVQKKKVKEKATTRQQHTKFKNWGCYSSNMISEMRLLTDKLIELIQMDTNHLHITVFEKSIDSVLKKDLEEEYHKE